MVDRVIHQAPHPGEIANAALQALVAAAIFRHETQFILQATAATQSKGTISIPTLEESRDLARIAFDLVAARLVSVAPSFCVGVEAERDTYLESLAERHAELIQWVRGKPAMPVLPD